MLVFVYGSLKRGFSNHDRYCRGFLSAEEAVVRGRLFETPYGFPAMEVPEEDVLAPGGPAILADLALQKDFSDRLARAGSDRNVTKPTLDGGGWGRVRGEVLSFGHPARRLSLLDRLEGFRSGTRSLYRRVLLPVRVGTRWVPVWAYVRGDRLKGCLRRLPEGVWRTG